MENPVKEKVQSAKMRRPRRTKADIEEAIRQAAIKIITKKGFSKTLVTDIVREAQIEPVVFYNRYRNLEEFYREFLKDYENWWPTLLEDIGADITTEQGVEQYHRAILDRLCSDEVILEILRWEISDANPVTLESAVNRQEKLLPHYRIMHETFNGCTIDMFPIIILIGGGMIFFTLLKDRCNIAAIDISSETGRDILRQAVHNFARIIFAFKHHDELLEDKDVPQIPLTVVQDRMRQEGISEDVIARVTEF